MWKRHKGQSDHHMAFCRCWLEHLDELQDVPNCHMFLFLAKVRCTGKLLKLFQAWYMRKDSICVFQVYNRVDPPRIVLTRGFHSIEAIQHMYLGSETNHFERTHQT